jgi:hypothetical protein
MPDVNNIYQLLAFLIVVGFQVYTQRGVSKVAGGQSTLKDEIEATRLEMFRLANLTGAPILRTEGRIAGLTTTIEAALKVAYLQGKADGRVDATYPHARIAAAAKTLAEHAIQGQELIPPADHPAPADGAAPQPKDAPAL